MGRFWMSRYLTDVYECHRHSIDGIKELVNYQTISPKDLAKSILSKGGWSDFLVLDSSTVIPRLMMQ